MTATDPVQAVMDVLGCKKRRDLNGTAFCGEHHFGWLRDVNACPRAERAAETAVAAARPLIAAEALREAADLVGGSSGPRHGVKMPDEQEWAQWLYDRADRIERGADQ